MKLLTKANDIQKSALNLLLQKFNGSKTFKGSNKVRQNFYIKPEDVFPQYNDDFADAVSIRDFEADLEVLEGENLIRLEKRGGVISKIYAVTENICFFHEIIGVNDKRTELQTAETILQSYIGRHEILDKICAAQLERIKNSKIQNIAKDSDSLGKMLECLNFILTNKDEILERELSIELFGDSKLFENKFKNRICSLLSQYSGLDMELSGNEKSGKNDELLSRYLIVKNPTYFYFKGNGLITFNDGKQLDLSFHRPIALRSDSVSDIKSVTILCDSIMTIENLTSFNRLNSEEYFCLFLSGYNNSCKAEFLKALYHNNSKKRWLHFGDIDPDGFYILHNLRMKTDIDFQPFLMGIAELKRFKKYCKSLETNDVAKAKSLIENNIFSEAARFMLDNDCKLEQEIISWKIDEYYAIYSE